MAIGGQKGVPKRGQKWVQNGPILAPILPLFSPPGGRPQNRGVIEGGGANTPKRVIWGVPKRVILAKKGHFPPPTQETPKSAIFGHFGHFDPFWSFWVPGGQKGLHIEEGGGHY